MLLADTPLARWMEANDYSVLSLARELGLERTRVQHYVHRRAFPQGPVLVRLIELTGLAAADFLPVSATPAPAKAKTRRSRRAA